MKHNANTPHYNGHITKLADLPKLFELPKTPRVIVTYNRQGTRYVANIANPHTNQDLQVAMLSRKVSLRDVVSVEPFTPYVKPS